MATKKTNSADVEVMEVQRGVLTFCVLGRAPLICNAMSAKIMQELLLPSEKKSAAKRRSTAKHDVLQEYRDSVYRDIRDDAPTEIVMPSTAFKGAIMGAALDLDGVTKARVGRQTFVLGVNVNIYGVPQLMMSVTRSANVARTPDVRTRAILPEWCAFVSVGFTKPIFKEKDVANLMAAAGVTQGIGDWRIGKGAGSFGEFELVDGNNETFARIKAEGGREAQRAALEEPVPFDSETDALLRWYEVETRRRGFEVVV